MTEEDLSARVARAFPISLEERAGKAGAEHISELERLVNEDKIGDAILYLRVNEQNIGQDLVATLDTYLLRQLTAPLNMDSSRAAAFRSDLDTKILSLLELINYNKNKIRISGSAITGKSSKTGKLFSSESDIDLGVIVSNAQFDDLVASIESKLFEGKNIESYRASREYKEFLKQRAKGKISKFWLNKIARDKSLSFQLEQTAQQYGHKSIDLSFIREGSEFDTSQSIPLFQE